MESPLSQELDTSTLFVCSEGAVKSQADKVYGVIDGIRNSRPSQVHNVEISKNQVEGDSGVEVLATLQSCNVDLWKDINEKLFVLNWVVTPKRWKNILLQDQHVVHLSRQHGQSLFYCFLVTIFEVNEGSVPGTWVVLRMTEGSVASKDVHGPQRRMNESMLYILYAICIAGMLWFENEKSI